jgi:hypothetical protein
MPVISKLLGVNWIFKTLMQSLYQASHVFIIFILFVKKEIKVFFLIEITLFHFTSNNISKSNTKLMVNIRLGAH